MTFKEIKDLIELLKESNLAELIIKKNDFELKIKTEKYLKGKNVLPPSAAIQSGMPITMSNSGAESMSESAQNVTDASSSAESGTGDKDGNVLEVKSPIVGTFYRSSGPDKPPFVKVGDKIDVGSVVCIVEAMKLFNEIESEVAGTVVKVLVEDASPVEYDQPLFLIEA